MFTGLIREVGRVAAVDGGAEGVRLTIDAPETARGARLGDSIALSGVCLTVVDCSDGRLAFDAVPETLARSSLQTLEPGSRVNAPSNSLAASAKFSRPLPLFTVARPRMM